MNIFNDKCRYCLKSSIQSPTVASWENKETQMVLECFIPILSVFFGIFLYFYVAFQGQKGGEMCQIYNSVLIMALIRYEFDVRPTWALENQWPRQAS